MPVSCKRIVERPGLTTYEVEIRGKATLVKLESCFRLMIADLNSVRPSVADKSNEWHAAIQADINAAHHQHQDALDAWNKLSWVKRIFTRKPRQAAVDLDNPHSRMLDRIDAALEQLELRLDYVCQLDPDDGIYFRRQTGNIPIEYTIAVMKHTKSNIE